MKKAAFYVAYGLSPVAVCLLFLFPAFRSANVPTGKIVASIFGITAFVLFCNQVILGSRPRQTVEALGSRHLLRLHMIMGIVAWIFTVVHNQLKEALLFSEDTAQATLGSLALALFAIVMILTLVFMANTFVSNWKLVAKVRQFGARYGFNYPKYLFMHDATLVIALVAVVHILMAKTSVLAVNPVGAIIIPAYYLMAVGFWAFYRARKSRKTRGSAVSTYA